MNFSIKISENEYSKYKDQIDNIDDPQKRDLLYFAIKQDFSEEEMKKILKISSKPIEVLAKKVSKIMGKR